MKKNKVAVLLMVLFAVAFALRLAVAVKLGFTHPMESDSYYYLQLAKSLSHGTGYHNASDSFWPGQPTMQRMPGWPFLIAMGLKLCPFISPDILMRILCITLDSLNAALVGWLTLILVQRRSVNHEAHKDQKVKSGATLFLPLGALSALRGKEVLLAGLLYAVHPAALFLVYNGESEPLFVALCLTGFILLLRGGWWVVVASLCFGLSCLVRANYVMWIGVAGVLMAGYGLWVVGRKNRKVEGRVQRSGFRVQNVGLHSEAPTIEVEGLASRGLAANRSDLGPQTSAIRLPQSTACGLPAVALAKVGLLSVVLFLAPALLWSARNYQVCGHFPVLSTLRGQTFYGGNNPVVADTLEMWGYWVFPDGISGEKKAAELARTMSEYELDVYYYKRGMDYVKREWFAMPRLLLGKLVRAYVPIPWKPNILSYGVGVYRALIYLLSVLGLIWWWRQSKTNNWNDNVAPLCERNANAPITDRCYIQSGVQMFNLVFIAMILTNVAGVLIFWGCFRFAFVLEPLLIPFAAMGVGLMMGKCVRGGGGIDHRL